MGTQRDVFAAFSLGFGVMVMVVPNLINGMKRLQYTDRSGCNNNIIIIINKAKLNLILFTSCTYILANEFVYTFII